MDTLRLKASIINLAETTENQHILAAVLAYFKEVVNNNNSLNWDQLSKEEQQEVLDAFLESETESELLPIDKALEKLK